MNKLERRGERVYVRGRKEDDGQAEKENVQAKPRYVSVAKKAEMENAHKDSTR